MERGSCGHVRRNSFNVFPNCGVMLEALLQSPGELRGRRDLRRELFRFFHTVVHTLQLTFERPAEEVTDRRLRDAVGALPLREREALMLTSLCGFETGE